MNLVLLPATPETYAEYHRIAGEYDAVPPSNPDCVVLVGVRLEFQGATTTPLVAGVSMYRAGTYTLIEGLFAAQGAPPRLVHRAVDTIATFALSDCAMRGSVPVIPILHRLKGLKGLLKRRGLIEAPSALLTFPGVPSVSIEPPGNRNSPGGSEPRKGTGKPSTAPEDSVASTPEPVNPPKRRRRKKAARKPKADA